MALLELFERLATDPGFLKGFQQDVEGTLEKYELKPEVKKALLSGDVQRILEFVREETGRGPDEVAQMTVVWFTSPPALEERHSSGKRPSTQKRTPTKKKSGATRKPRRK